MDWGAFTACERRDMAVASRARPSAERLRMTGLLDLPHADNLDLAGEADSIADGRPRLVDHAGRRRIDVGEQPVDLGAADRIDLESGLERLGDEIRILHGGVERRAQSEEHTSELLSRPHLVCRLL